MEQDFSAVFLSLYEETKKRFRERGLHASIQTLEKCQAMLLVFLRKGRPVRPYVLVDSLIPYPPFNHCKDAKRMVFYILERLMEIGIAEPVEYVGREGYYRLVPSLCEGFSASKPGVISQVTDARTKPLQENWRRIYEVRNILRLWKLPSLAHSMIYELTSLLRYVEALKGESRRDGISHLESVEKNAKELIVHYTEFSRSGTLSEEEHQVFTSLDEGIHGFSTMLWWRTS
jgi:hypothetical protein